MSGSRGFRRVLVLVLLTALTVPPGPSTIATAAPSSTTQRVGLSRDGSQLRRDTEFALTSGDGRYVIFASKSARVVAGDGNGQMDVFIRDLAAGTNEIVSVATSGTQANAASAPTAVSPDGRFVVFVTAASNLAEPDVDPGLEQALDVFIRDRELRTTERVSVNSDEQPGNAPSFAGDVSDDGRYVVFESGAGNLVANDDNQTYDVFVRDRESGTTEIASVRSNGRIGNYFSSAPTISGDGRFVAFESGASNLVKDDTNRATDSFVHDRVLGTTRRISVTSAGAQVAKGGVDPDIAEDGSAILFYAEARIVSGDHNGVGDAYLYEMDGGAVKKMSQRCGKPCFPNAISPDGRYLVYHSKSSGIVPGDTNGEGDYFWFDRQEKIVTRVNVNNNGGQARGDKGFWIGADISADGRYVVFESAAHNLVPGDTNDAYDVFQRGPITP